MKANEQIVLTSISLESIASCVSDIILKNIGQRIAPPPEKTKPEYLTRKQSYIRLGITGPTFDKLIKETKTEKLGEGKGARFRKEDIEHIYENLNKYLYKR